MNDGILTGHCVLLQGNHTGHTVMQKSPVDPSPQHSGHVYKPIANGMVHMKVKCYRDQRLCLQI